MRLLEFLLILILSAMLAGTGWYALEERGVAAKAMANALVAAQTRDAASASQAQARCAAEVQSSLKAGEAIARLSVVHVRSDPKVQPMFSASDIREAMQ